MKKFFLLPLAVFFLVAVGLNSFAEEKALTLSASEKLLFNFDFIPVVLTASPDGKRIACLLYPSPSPRDS